MMLVTLIMTIAPQVCNNIVSQKYVKLITESTIGQ